MRLLRLDDDGRGFSLVQYLGRDVPPYAILSHTWGSKEVNYQDLLSGTGVEKEGYKKLTFCAKQAAKDGLHHFWIDTCCINKESSAELSEAITSMFRWYHDAAQCYVYLADIQARKSEADQDVGAWESAFRSSRWFSRGWTLQELLAPPVVKFFCREGTFLGDKVSLERHIRDVTQIPKQAIRGAALAEFDVEERISWIEQRQTTREEDMAYSLLGILNVSMLPNYGEGKESAFKRLRREVREALGNPKISLRSMDREALLDSLWFKQITGRQMTIKDAHFDTCRWLLTHSEYTTWLDKDAVPDHHGFLWIKGKPGTGKSTLMKFALAQAYQESSRKAVISFFFHARGETLEKSVIGTYRSLLFQLLAKFPFCQSAFDCLELSKSPGSSKVEWSVEILKRVLEEAIMLLTAHPTVCFIDALDECEDEQVRDMIRFFENLGERSLAAGISFHICLSSRHYPHITIRYGVSLVLEGQEGHSKDILHYLKGELAIGQSPRASQLQQEIQRKASGVFMWVVLVVKIMNKEYERGRLHSLQKKLQDIPTDLHELFRNILTRDSHEMDELVLCVQWVLFAKQPLTVQELYFAILSGVDPAAASPWEQEDINQDAMERFVLDCSRGLVDTTTTRNKTIQFIHESVRDFLLEGDGLSKIWPEVQSNFASRSHERLKECCINYMITTTASPTAPAAPGGHGVVDYRVTKAIPFLWYTAENMFYHAEAAQKGGISQKDFLQEFPFIQWTDLVNSMRPAAEYTKNVSLTYVLAHRNMLNLLQLRPQVPACLDEEYERYGCPLFAAAANGSRQVVQAIVDVLMGNGHLYGHTASSIETTDALLKSVTSDFEYSRARGVLSHAAEFGVAPLVAFMLSSIVNAKEDVSDDRGRTPLWWASKEGHTATVELLIGANVNIQNANDGTPLYVAAANGHIRVVRLLIDCGADVNLRGGNESFALIAALSKRSENHEEVARMLLNMENVNVSVTNERGITPLLLAARHGLEAIVALLLAKGASTDVQSDDGQSALMSAIYESRRGAVKLLLDNNADVNLQGGHHGNAIQAAALRGDIELLKALIDWKTDLNVQCGYYGTALQAAASRYSSEYTYDAAASAEKTFMVQLLIDRGANVNIIGGCYGTALQAAAHSGSLAVVKLLIDHGADVNAQGGAYGTALQAASYIGHETIARLLIQQGADINAQCGAYGTALQAAAAVGRLGIVKLLIAESTDINAQCGLHGSALKAALSLDVENIWRDDIVALLRQHGAALEHDVSEEYPSKRPRIRN